MSKDIKELTTGQGAFSLIEALLWAGGYQRMDLHLARLERSAVALAFPFDHRHTLACLAAEEKTLRASVQHKVRLELDQHGELHCASEPIPAVAADAPLTITLSPLHTDSADPLLRHKTTRRMMFDQERHRAQLDGHADILFRNERDEVTEGAISNLFARFGAHLVTPPIGCGLLPGIARAVALAERPGASEAVLTMDDLIQADELFICNAVRGWRRVRLAGEGVH
jgi:para-aminobenzoate synthetase/4-amino-4-deoxychorismate lyase